jgi:hypothetical protein
MSEEELLEILGGPTRGAINRLSHWARGSTEMVEVRRSDLMILLTELRSMLALEIDVVTLRAFMAGVDTLVRRGGEHTDYPRRLRALLAVFGDALEDTSDTG